MINVEQIEDCSIDELLEIIRQVRADILFGETFEGNSPAGQDYVLEALAHLELARVALRRVKRNW